MLSVLESSSVPEANGGHDAGEGRQTAGRGGSRREGCRAWRAEGVRALPRLGLFNALVIPGFDAFDRDMWGLVTVGVAVAGFVATFVYFLLRSMKVDVKPRSPWWAWVVLGLWIGLASFVGPALDDTTAFSYTLAGLVAAAPLLAWGLRLRRWG